MNITLLKKGVLFIMIKVMIMTLIMINNTPFFKSVIFNCFQFKKSEPHLDYDCIFTVLLNFHPNRFCFISEPHEFVWKSVWSIPHWNFRSKFHIFFNILWNLIFRFLRFQTQENRFLGPGDVFACFLCPQIHQFIYSVVNFL